MFYLKSEATLKMSIIMIGVIESTAGVNWHFLTLFVDVDLKQFLADEVCLGSFICQIKFEFRPSKLIKVGRI